MIISLKSVDDPTAIGAVALESSNEPEVRTYIAIFFAGKIVKVDANELRVAVEALCQVAR